MRASPVRLGMCVLTLLASSGCASWGSGWLGWGGSSNSGFASNGPALPSSQVASNNPQGSFAQQDPFQGQTATSNYTLPTNQAATSRWPSSPDAASSQVTAMTPSGRYQPAGYQPAGYQPQAGYAAGTQAGMSNSASALGGTQPNYNPYSAPASGSMTADARGYSAGASAPSASAAPSGYQGYNTGTTSNTGTGSAYGAGTGYSSGAGNYGGYGTQGTQVPSTSNPSSQPSYAPSSTSSPYSGGANSGYQPGSTSGTGTTNGANTAPGGSFNQTGTTGNSNYSSSYNQTPGDYTNGYAPSADNRYGAPSSTAPAANPGMPAYPPGSMPPSGLPPSSTPSYGSGSSYR